MADPDGALTKPCARHNPLERGDGGLDCVFIHKLFRRILLL
jgi:hypothetical protein